MTLSNGSVFELTWTENGTAQTLIVVHLPITRPSAKPLHGPAVFRFSTITGERFTRSVEHIASVTAVQVADLPHQLIEQLTEPLHALAEIEADRIPTADLEALFTTVESDEACYNAALIARYTLDGQDLTDERSNAVLAFLKREAVADLWDDVSFARPAIRSLAAVAQDDPAAVIDFVPHVAIAAEIADLPTRRSAIYTCTRLASEYPEEVLPMLDLLIDGIASEDGNMQQNALSALGHIVQSYPDAAEPVASDVATLFESEEATVRANAVGLFGDLAVGHPDITMQYGAELVKLLEDEEEEVRRNASIALLRAGESNPEVFNQHTAILATALEDDVMEVRRNICSIIGNATVEVSREQLEQLAANDPDDIVRDRAEWAITRLE